MFTIKHIDENGNEFAIEATSYAITRERRANAPDFIRILTYDTPHQSNDYTGLWAGIPPQGGLASQTIFVMNRYGSTVTKIGFDATPADYCSDPNVAVPLSEAKLAA
jgi:hypothetical protein